MKERASSREKEEIGGERSSLQFLSLQPWARSTKPRRTREVRRGGISSLWDRTAPRNTSRARKPRLRSEASARSRLKVGSTRVRYRWEFALFLIPPTLEATSRFPFPSAFGRSVIAFTGATIDDRVRHRGPKCWISS